MRKFLELLYDLVDFLELSMLINASLLYIYYLMKWKRYSDMEKYIFFRYHLYQFFKKTVTDDLN